MKINSTIAVVGGGPAGLMAAEVLATAGFRVTLYDAMPKPGCKFLMAGKGGLNLTRDEPLTDFVQKYGRNAQFFAQLLKQFSPNDLREWAKAKGVATFVGSSGRVFPKESGAGRLLTAWLQHLSELGVDIRTGYRWLGFTADRTLRFCNQQGEEISIHPDAALLSLGGASWPQTGSDGRWSAILAAAGIKVERFRPANCGFEVAWSSFFRQRFAGAPLKNLTLITESGSTAHGDIVITDYGIEGGAVYTLCAELRDKIEEQGQATLYLDLKRDLTEPEILERLAKSRHKDTFSNHLRKTLKISGPLPSLIKECVPSTDLVDLKSFSGLIKKMPLVLKAPRPLVEAISTAGGIAMVEINEDLMLRKLPGIFVAGEMLDWEAPTGGYLLQGVFSTGVAAAHGIMHRLRN